MGAAEWCAWLRVANPGERVKAELLNGVRGGVAAAKHDTLWIGFAEKLMEELAEYFAKTRSVRGCVGLSKCGVDDGALTCGKTG